MRTVILSAALCIALSASALSAPPKPPASRPASRPAVVADPQPRTEYDKFRDVTTVMLGPFPLSLDKGNGRWLLGLVATHKGETASGIHSDILITLQGKPGAEGGPMIFLLDGKHRVEAPASNRVERTADDLVVFTVDDKALAWIAESKKVEGQGAGVEFTLTPEQIEGVREFQRALQRTPAAAPETKPPAKKR